MSESIRDVATLGRIAFDAGWNPIKVDEWGHTDPANWDDLPDEEWADQGYEHWLPPKREFVNMAEAVKVAVCPPDHVVVKRAEHDARERLRLCLRRMWAATDGNDEAAAFMRSFLTMLHPGDLEDTPAAYRAALGTEASE